ncbi:hypothetical protein HPP92_011168 [Vanilla planifolia]|uniref:Uncharacterized protein n=1 Tax=Vanilla planifolia TaxID=51239 RepID=A0A835V1I9_VANPL|nr:hypothetical protein HPP92_011168 [Vanilla planifolia]
MPFHGALKPSSKTEESSTKKRKRLIEEEATDSEEGFHPREMKAWKAEKQKLNSSIELNLDNPLPVEWQRCLDIKRRTWEDPTCDLELPSPRPAVDLELNLMCDPSESRVSEVQVAAHGDNEMVAMVCARCHLLVMMCKASPCCPNCKFAHPPGMQGSSDIRRKPTRRWLCCGDC